ncbi:hypothetical protein BGZ49_003259 [Haplosporangium sp. Z 27]|nr:hypothetical protein BGZ49_003259 [Haplosporangium sp. Z 27]
MSASKQQYLLSRHFPEPIVYQYTLYYPGNIPLVITAGHGGSAIPGNRTSRVMTHRFKRIHDLATTSATVGISSFSESVASKDDSQLGEMPWMPLRDQSQGGNFKNDLNTHSMALSIANAVTRLSCRETSDDPMTSSRTQKGSTERCDALGPWGDDDLDFPSAQSPPFTPSTTPRSHTPSSGPHSCADGTTRTRYHSNLALYHPHVVVFRVPRRYVDVNRNITGENATPDHPISKAAWHEYHDLIDHVQKLAVQKQLQQQQQRQQLQQLQLRQLQQLQYVFDQVVPGGTEDWKKPIDTGVHQNPRGLLLDIHGHTHPTNLIEIGYLLNGSTLAMEDGQMNANAYKIAKEASVCSLISRVVKLDPSIDLDQEPGRGQGDKVLFSELIRGWNESLGGMFQSQGLNAVPSPGNKAPVQEGIYFFGGYTTQYHGSRDQRNDGSFSSYDAIQLELPRFLRMTGKEGREIGMKMGRAVVQFTGRYYDIFEDHDQSRAAIATVTTKEGQETRNQPIAPVPKARYILSFEQRHPDSARPRFERVFSHRESLRTEQNPKLQQQQQQQPQMHHSKSDADAVDNHSGDSDIEDEAMGGSRKLTHRIPEMKRQSSRL